jgi:hypothetical protein
MDLEKTACGRYRHLLPCISAFPEEETPTKPRTFLTHSDPSPNPLPLRGIAGFFQ